MACPIKRKGSDNWWFRRATPRDILAKREALEALGVRVTREFTVSLGTKDRSETRLRCSEQNARCEAMWQAWRDALANGPRVLTQEEIFAVVSDAIREARAKIKSNPGNPSTLAAMLEHFTQLAESPPGNFLVQLAETWRNHLAKHYGWPVVAKKSLDALVAQSLRDMPKAITMRAAMAREGDYREPEWLKARPSVSLETASKAVPVAELIEGWKREKRPKATSVRAYEVRVDGFVKLIGHSDAARFLAEDVQRWKDHLLASSDDKSLKDVKLKLDALRGLLRWGIANRRLPFKDNPAQDVRVSLGKSRVKARRGFTDTEAVALLKRARQATGFARWGVWLMAFSGMRPGEAAQLRVQDVAQHKTGQWAITVTAEAGTLKTPDSERIVPLHSALVAEGILQYVSTLPGSGRLFPELFAKAAGAQADDRLTQRARNQVHRSMSSAPAIVIPDGVSVLHSWRHRFKTLCREHGLTDAASRAIMGHEEEGAAGGYGERPGIVRLSEEIERILSPRLG